MTDINKGKIRKDKRSKKMKETSKTIVTVLEKPRENKPTKKEEKTMVNRDVLVIPVEKSIVKDSSIIKERKKYRRISI